MGYTKKKNITKSVHHKREDKRQERKRLNPN